MVGEPQPSLTMLPCYLLGQLVDPVEVKEGRQIVYSSLSEAKVTIHTVAASACPARG